MDSGPGAEDITAAFRDLHRRSGPAPRKRTRFAPAKPPGQPAGTSTSQPLTQAQAASQAAQSFVTSSVPVMTPASNGRPTPVNTNGPQRKTVFHRIADAQLTADARPRPDPRFLSGPPALNCMPDIASSVGVSLFSNGYARHDGILSHAAGISAPRTTDVLSLPRMPYDAASRPFLRSLELGVLPLDEDLPPESARKYYDGCLVAEVFDYRGVDDAVMARPDAWRQRGAFVRVLLKRDACSQLADVEMLTDGLNESDAVRLEGRLLLAEHPMLDLDPTPRASTRERPLWRPLVRARRRRGPRPTGMLSPPPLSMSALMLIASAAKSQILGELKVRNARATDGTPSGSSVASSPKPTGSGARSPAPPSAAALGALHAKARQCILSTQPARGPSGPASPPRSHGRLRTIRLILPDKATHARYRQLKALVAGGGGNLLTHEHIVQEAFKHFSRSGRQVCIIELVARAGKGSDVALFRGVFGDRAKDVNKMSLGSLEAANCFMDHFKGIMEKEGYVCIHDGDPQLSPQTQAQADARRRAAVQQNAAVAAAAPGQGLSPAAAQQAQAMAVRKRQFAMLQAQGKVPPPGSAGAAQAAAQRGAQQRLLQQGIDPRRAYAAGVAQMQQQARAGEQAAGILQAQAALNAAAASKSAARYNQQLATLPRAAGAPADGRPDAGGGRGAIMSQLHQFQQAQQQQSPAKQLQLQRQRLAATRYPAVNASGIDPAVVRQHQQQILAARAAQQAAQAAGIGGMQAISPSLLGLDAGGHSYKSGEEGNQEGSRGGKR